MSATIYSYLILGIPCDYRDFFVDKKDANLTCDEGHVFSGSAKRIAKFCPDDGTKFVQRITQHPTEEFANYCRKEGAEPELLWQDWMDEELGGKAGVGVININVVQPEREQIDRYCFGLCLHDISPYSANKDIKGFNLGELELISKSIIARAAPFKCFNKSPRIFHCLYCS